MNWWARYEVTLTTDGRSKTFYFTDRSSVRWALYLAKSVGLTTTTATARDRWTGKTIEG